MTPSRADRAPGSPQVAAGAGVGVGAGASNVSSSASPSPKKKSVTIASPRQSPASVSSPRLTEEELSRRAMERMRRASVMVAAKRAVGSISTTAHAAARLKTAAAIRMAEKKEDEERAMKKKKQGGAAGAAASGGSETAEDGQSPAGDAVPVKQRVLGYVMKGLDTATYFACNPGFVARAIRFLLLIIAVHLFVAVALLSAVLGGLSCAPHACAFGRVLPTQAGILGMGLVPYLGPCAGVLLQRLAQ